MARSAINTGFPGPNYVVELGNRDAILPGTYEIEQGARSVTSSQSIGNLTLAATAAVIDNATLSQTIAALTLAAAGGTTVSASLSTTLGDVTLAAIANVVDGLVLAATIDPITLAATVEIIDGLVLAATIDPITLVATVDVVDTIVLDATIGAISLAATATGGAARSRDGVFPWWWRQYVARHEAERALAEEKARRDRELWRADHAVEGDVYAVASAPIAHGEGEHVPPLEDEIAALSAIWLLLTDGAGDLLADDVAEFWDPGEAAVLHVHPDEEAAIAAAMSFLIKEREYA
jgi:hypothetical protein